MISHNEVDTHLQSGHNTERNLRNAILIRVHLSSNDHRGKRQYVVGWPKAPATRVHTTIGGSRFGLGLARTA